MRDGAFICLLFYLILPIVYLSIHLQSGHEDYNRFNLRTEKKLYTWLLFSLFRHSVNAG